MRFDSDIHDGQFNQRAVSQCDDLPRVVVEPDRVRLALGHRYNWYAEPMVFSVVQVMIRALLFDYDVLVDDTNTSKESMLRLLECDHRAYWAYVDTDVNTCWTRAEQTGQADLIPVIRRQQYNLHEQMYAMCGDSCVDIEQLKKLINGHRRTVMANSSRKVIV